jgi:RNA polymerase sigma factor (sigma-70 family)
MQHHERNYITAVTAERRAKAARRRAADGASELEQLVRRAAASDESAWAAILRRFSCRVRYVAGAHNLSADDVDDVVQSTFIRLHEHIDDLRNPDALPAWLATTARRESLQRLRAGARASVVDPEAFEGIPAPECIEDDCIDDALRRELAGAIARLPERQRRLLEELFADEPRGYETISRRLDMPIGSIGPTRARAIERLREDARLRMFQDA